MEIFPRQTTVQAKQNTYDFLSLNKRNIICILPFYDEYEQNLLERTRINKRGT